MSRPKKYANRISTSLSLEREIYETVTKLDYSFTDIFMKGWSVVIPNNMTGAEYRKKQIDRECKKLQDQAEELLEQISILENEKRELDAKVVINEVDTKAREELIKKHQGEFWENTKCPPTWEFDDPEESKWWARKGVVITYGELRKRWHA